MNRREDAREGSASGAGRASPSEWLVPGTPLTEPELALLAQLQGASMLVAGLTLEVRVDGSISVAAFQPPQGSNESAGLTLRNLASGGQALYDAGQFTFAAASFALCLRLNSLHVGPEHTDTLTAANNLAGTLFAQGNLADARRLQELVFETFQRVRGPEHPHTLTSANNLAVTLDAQGALADARRLQEWVLESRQRILPAEHPDTLCSADNLANVLRAQGDVDGAHLLQKSALETLQRVQGLEHPDSLIAAINLANTLCKRGELASARRLLESVFETSQRDLGAEHPVTLSSASNLAETLCWQGDLSGARGIQEAVFETFQHVLGAEHPDTLTSANNLAGTLWAQGDLAAGAERCLAALKALAGSVRIDSSALGTAAFVPMLVYPNQDWPASAVAALPKVLAQLSKSAQAQLLALPIDSAQPMYQALLTLHWRWGVFVSCRLPKAHLVDALLAILAPLHGSQAWAELGQEAIAAASLGSASPPALAYAAAAAHAHQLRDAVHSALQKRTQFNQQALNLQHVLSRIRRGEGKQAEQAAADPGFVPRLQLEWEHARREAEAARVALDRLSDESRAANAAVAKALHTLAASDPVLGSLAEKPNPTETTIQATLAEDEVWLVPLPGKAVEPDPDLRKWNDQAANNPSFVLALRKNQPGQIVPILPTGHLGLLSDLCRSGVRHMQRGLLRDSAAGTDPTEPRPLRNEPLSFLQDATRAGFWSKLSPLLQGVRRIHLVTAAGSHDLMFEAGRPAEHEGTLLHRYCGLPAYWRSAPMKPGALRPTPRYCWIHDESWSDAVALPFTVLDSFVLRHRGLGSGQTADDLHDNGPAADVLVISSHGLVAGGGTSRGGQLVIGGRQLPPARLRQRRNDPSSQGLRGLIALSCFGGVVGSTGHGDPLGTISALQTAGLEWAIACLAPVPDFYTPMFSAILLHEMQTQDDPALALDSAKRILTHGPWDGTLQREVIEPLRQAYRTRMLELLDEAVNHGGEAEQIARSQKILQGVHGWSLPRACRRALGAMTIEQFVPDIKQAQESFVDECLDVLLRQPQDRDAQDDQEDSFVIQALQHLAAVTVFFGRG